MVNASGTGSDLPVGIITGDRMRTRLLFLLASAIVTPPLAAQGALLARAEAPVETLYHLRLTSAWPELRLSPECVNGGEEVLSGSLHWVSSGRYRGELNRQTTHTQIGWSTSWRMHAPGSRRGSKRVRLTFAPSGCVG